MVQYQNEIFIRLPHTQSQQLASSNVILRFLYIVRHLIIAKANYFISLDSFIYWSDIWFNDIHICEIVMCLYNGTDVKLFFFVNPVFFTLFSIVLTYQHFSVWFSTGFQIKSHFFYAMPNEYMMQLSVACVLSVDMNHVQIDKLDEYVSISLFCTLYMIRLYVSHKQFVSISFIYSCNQMIFCKLLTFCVNIHYVE